MQPGGSGEKTTGPSAAASPAPSDDLAPWTSPWFWGTLLVLGLVVRFRQYLGDISYWYDEAFYLVNIYHRSFPKLVGAIDCAVAAPPLYLWLERAVYLTLGPAEWAMRLPSVLAGLAALLLLIPLGRRLVGGPGWAWALGFCSLSAHAVQHACEVHPYAIDMLVTETILYAALLWLSPGVSPRPRFGAAAFLLAAALVFPWLSFPSAFVLGAAGLALGGEAFRRRSPRDGVLCAAFLGLLMLSGAALYYVHARYLYYPGLQEGWADGYPKSYTPLGVLRWACNVPVEIGNYATAAMGIPLTVFGVLGAAVLARRSWPLAVLTAGPIPVSMAVALLHRYPLDNRLLMFAGPCVWLLAAAGVSAVLQRFRGRLRWAAAAACCVLLAPGLFETAKEIWTVTPRGDWRGAFAYVHGHKADDDKVWVAFPETYETYFGRPAGYLGNLPQEEVERRAPDGRMWIVAPTRVPGTRRLVQRLEAGGWARRDEQFVNQLTIFLFAPSEGVGRGLAD